MYNLGTFYEELAHKHPLSNLYNDLLLIKDLYKHKHLKLEKIVNLDNFVKKYNYFFTPTITCAIMTFNEERCIKRCLQSVCGKFDQIIILDSESTDNTIDIVESNFPSVQIYSEKWEKDFSHHRNKLIELSEMEWIYFLDADNVYLDTQDSARRVAKLIEYLEISCVINPIIHENNGHIITDNQRMFSKNTDIIFSGKIHEEPIYKSNLQSPYDIAVGINIYHDGYDSALVNQREKTERNIELSQKMMESEPLNLKWHYFYARELEFLKKKDKAKKVISNSLKLYESTSEKRYYLETNLLYCKILLEEGSLNELSNQLNKLENKYPNCIDIDYFNATLLCLDIQKRTFNVISYLITNSLHNERKFSLMNTSNDHIKNILTRLYGSIGDWESSYNMYKEIRSSEIKNDYKDFLKNISKFGEFVGGK
jgi:SunS family peptide S-glycosyltransferase